MRSWAEVVVKHPANLKAILRKHCHPAQQHLAADDDGEQAEHGDERDPRGAVGERAAGRHHGRPRHAHDEQGLAAGARDAEQPRLSVERRRLDDGRLRRAQRLQELAVDSAALRGRRWMAREDGAIAIDQRHHRALGELGDAGQLPQPREIEGREHDGGKAAAEIEDGRGDGDDGAAGRAIDAILADAELPPLAGGAEPRPVGDAAARGRARRRAADHRAVRAGDTEVDVARQALAELGQQRAAALAAAHLREAREQLERLLRLGQRALVRIGGQARELEGVLAGRGGELAALLGGKVEHEDQGGQHCQADDGEEVPADTDDAPRHDSRANRKKRTRVGPAGRRGASARGRWRPRPGHDSVTSKR